MMLRTLTLTLLCGLGASQVLAIGPLPFEQAFYKGKAVPFYGNGSDTRSQKLIDGLKQDHYSERMAQVAQDTFHLRRNLAVGFETCGTPNAFYSPQRSALVICVEMVQLLINQAKADPDIAAMSVQNFNTVIKGALWGIYFHELGHAIIDINRIQITGREEDVADQFALYFAVKMVEPKNVPVVLPTIWFFKRLANNTNIAAADQDTVRRLMSDEHSLGEQRIYNIACWAYGADQYRGAAVAKLVNLPPERGARCIEEFSRLEGGITSRFRKYFINKKF